jgi:hypothetical protein
MVKHPASSLGGLASRRTALSGLPWLSKLRAAVVPGRASKKSSERSKASVEVAQGELCGAGEDANDKETSQNARTSRLMSAWLLRGAGTAHRRAVGEGRANALGQQLGIAQGGSMRGYRILIQEAELMAMRPDAVAEYLKRRASELKDDARDDRVDEDVEEALRRRGDPLIDLALAGYGRHMEVVSGLFQAAAPGTPVRLACLSNVVLGRANSGFPACLLGQEADAMAQWLLTATDEELPALFENPTLDDSFLRDLLERSRAWKCIDDDRLCRFVSLLQRNPRMRTAWDDEWMDGYAEYSYGSVFNAAWKLAETAPTTERWAASLGSLYERLQADAFSINEPLTLARRWHVDPSDATAMARQEQDHAIGYLGNKERVRESLARLALRKSGKVLPDLLTSDDVAFRAAAYAAGDLNADQLRAGYVKDSEIAFNAAIRNEALWRRQETRQALRDIAWEVVHNDKHSDLLAANRFKSMEKDMRRRQPAWFSDEEESEEASYDEVDDQAAATKTDLSVIASHMDRQAQAMEAIGHAVHSLMSRAGWIFWFSLGALVASLRHF